VTYLNKILVYIDGSEQSITAAQYAICMASYFKAELIALYVVNTKAIQDLLKARIFLQAEQFEYENDIQADAERYLNYVEDIALKKGVKVTKKTAKGSIHYEITDVAKEGIDLLVIGEISSIISRRDELFAETERAMRAVPCSVLIVKDEDKVLEMYNSLV
jgi:nucleotide-binding universal stress UspA family protein